MVIWTYCLDLVRILAYSHCFYLLFLFLHVLLFLLLPYLFLFCSFLYLLVLHTVLFAAVAVVAAIDAALLLPSLVAVAIAVARLAGAANLSCFEADHVLVVVSAMLGNVAAVVRVVRVVLLSTVGQQAIVANVTSVAVLPSLVWARRPLWMDVWARRPLWMFGQMTLRAVLSTIFWGCALFKYSQGSQFCPEKNSTSPPGTKQGSKAKSHS